MVRAGRSAGRANLQTWQGYQNTNLTPLTATANKQHSGYELKIKAALTVSSQLERFKKIPAFTFGVDYRVDVIGQFGAIGPHSLAPDYIELTSKLVKLDDATGVVSDATDMDIDKVLDEKSRKHLKAARFAGIKIYNDAAHL
jgi:hypothetical protein